MNRLRMYKHLALLVAILAMIAIYPVLREHGDSWLLMNVLITAVFLAGGWVVFSDRVFRAVGTILAIPTLLGIWIGYTVEGLSDVQGLTAFHISAATYELLVAVVLIRTVMRQDTVTADAISGALCGYLLIGLAFGHGYCLLEVMSPGMFTGVAELDPDQQHFLLTYFSFITLTTVGYGDITPTGGPARSVSMVEAVLGQFYLAVLIAGLVGKWLVQPSPTVPPSPPTG